MSDPAFPPAVAVTRRSDGLRFRLPRRPLGTGTLAGLLCVVIGLVLAVGGAFGLSFALLWGFHWPAASATALGMVLNALLALVAPGIALAALALLAFGLYTAFIGAGLALGRDEITLTPTHLVVTLCLGPLRWPGRHPRERVSHLVLRPDRPWPNLQAEGEGLRPCLLAWNYPPAVLQPLAHHLAAAWADSGSGPPPRVVTGGPGRALPHEARDRPLNTRLAVESRNGTLVLADPPSPFWVMPQGCLTLLLVPATLLIAFITLVATLAYTGLGPPPEGPFVPPTTLFDLAMLVPFWLVIAAGALAALHRARRRVTLDARSGTLTRTRTGLFGARRDAWPAADLAGLEVVDDDGDVTLLARDRAGRAHALLARDADADCRGRAELEWAAALLRPALGLAPFAPPAVPP